MSNYIKPGIFFLLNFVTIFCTAQKAVKATYSGGHGCVSTSLILYVDSTYEYKTSTAIFFTMTSRSKGYYLIQDDAITLYRRKKLSFLYFADKKRYQPATFRMKDGDILMYSEADELSADSNFIKDYNTLWLEEPESKK